MLLEEDFEPAVASSLQAELERFANECWYDARRRKIVYRGDEAALRAYVTLQREQMDRHKWIESEKAHRDLTEVSLGQWIRMHSVAFSNYWKHTHAFIPSSSQVDAAHALTCKAAD